MVNELVVLWMLLFSVSSATAQVSVGIGFPNVSIGINLPLYPELVAVPGYPVYYAPQVNSNYFFYDGMYWVYQEDNWYASSWYNGPWWLMAPEDVPLYILRVPVSYYRQPPVYFQGWVSSAPPRWGEHWGDAWTQRRSGWDRWNRSSAPAPAPLPVYQRKYSGAQYPGAQQQQVLQSQNYRYQPRDPVVRQHYQAQQGQSAPALAPRGAQAVPKEKTAVVPDSQRPNPAATVRQNAPTAPRGQLSPKPAENEPKPVPITAPLQKKTPPPVQQASPQPQQYEAVKRRQPEPKSQGENQQMSAPTAAPAQKRAPPVQLQSQQAQQPQQAAPQHQQPESKPHGPEAAPQGQGQGAVRETVHGQGQGQETDRGKPGERGQERNQ
jgi:hypothetical protein